MSLQFRRSQKVAPGVRVTVGSKAVGVSVGPRHAHIGYNTRTGPYLSWSIPGTGISYRSSLRPLIDGILEASQQKAAQQAAALPEFLQGANPFALTKGPPHLSLSNINEGGRRAWDALRAKQFTRAVPILEYLLTATPSNHRVAFYLSWALLGADPARGRFLMCKYLQHETLFAQYTHLWLGQHLLDLGDTINADRAFARAHDLFTEQDWRDCCYLHRARAALNAGSPNIALQLLCFIQIPPIPLDGVFVHVRFMRGECWRQMGEIANARSEWEEVAAFDPLLHDVTQLLKNL